MKHHRLSAFAAVFASLVTSTVLIGWTLDIRVMMSLVPGLPVMLPATAINVLLLSFSILLLSRSLEPSHGQRKSQIFSRIATCVASLASTFFGVVTLTGHILNVRTGLGQLLFPEQIAKMPELLYGGDSSLQASIACILLGFTLFTRALDPTSERRTPHFQLLPLAIIALALLAFVGYIHRISLYGPSKLIGFSFPAAVSFFVLSVGVLGLEPNVSLMQRLRSKRSDGFFLRWYTLASLVLPIGLAIVIAWGERLHLYSSAFSSALFAIFTIAGLFVLGLFMARAISRLENQRLAIEQAEAKAALLESEESLKDTKDRLEVALEASKMGTWESNLRDLTSVWSETAERLCGFKPGSFPGTHTALLKIIHPDDREKIVQARRRAIESRQDLDLDFRILRNNGEMRWIRCKGRAKYDADGTPIKISGTMADITAERNHQQTLEAALRAAESANELKTTFLANMSHEIRTPLGAILGFTELLSDPSASTEEKAHFLEVIARNGKTLSYLLNDILDLSKVEAGHLNVEILRFSVRELLEEVVSLLERNADEKGIYLRVDYAEAMPEMIGSDPIRLKQILINLIGNAIKFTSAGGVRVQVQRADARLVFTIEDTGMGIEESQKSKLFQAFSQADDSTTRKFGGTGLGLLLSRRLASLLGGSVDLQSSMPGVGSVFVASIQNIESASRPETATEFALERVPEFPELGDETQYLEGVRVLLAEDSLDNQKLISRVLTREGASVALVGDGQSCVEQALAADYDVVLMDIQMPVLDGYTATQRLRERGFEKPILALTAHAMSDVRDKCLEVGCSGYLTKPIDKTQLIRAIGTFIAF